MTTPTKANIAGKLASLTQNLNDLLYMNDVAFMENMKSNNLGCDDIEKYRNWEWPQGIGLFCIWKLFEQSKVESYLNLLRQYYDKQLEIGLPSLNVNTMAPFLALSYLAEYTGEEKYLSPCVDGARWIMERFPRTQQNGFQHTTSDAINQDELWADTLFMTVLFLANMGRILGKERYIEEAEYQFMLHIKYLQSNRSGLFYHGWTFNGKHNFTQALWARGNSWLTIAIPEFIEMTRCAGALKRFLVSTLNSQVDALKTYQDQNGMWHTLIDDADSYVESSATAGIGYGVLRAVKSGLLPEDRKALASNAIRPILEHIDKKGILNQVSYGTPMGRETIESYKNIKFCPMPYGQALAILFLHAYLHQEE